MGSLSGVYEGRIISVGDGNATAFVPQVFGDTVITISNFLGTPVAGRGWVTFQSGDPEHPVWLSGSYLNADVTGFTFSQPDTPKGTAEGQTWYNTASGDSYVFTANQWKAFAVSAGGGGGGGTAGFTFIRDTKPPTALVANTWFDTSTGPSGGTAWVAIEEGGAGSEVVWVQFAPGSATGVVSAIPAGSIQDYIGTTAPSGWLAMVGQAILNADTSYPNLWAVPGLPGKSGTTLTLPDTRGRVAVALNTGDASFSTIGAFGGAKTHTMTVAEMPVHGHDVIMPGTLGQASQHLAGDYGGTGSTAIPNTVTFAGGSFAYAANNGSGTAHNIMQPYITFLKIIRAY